MQISPLFLFKKEYLGLTKLRISTKRALAHFVPPQSIFVLFCFVWLATLGLPVVASRTAARAFPTRNKSAVIGAPAPKSLREAPLVQKHPRLE